MEKTRSKKLKMVGVVAVIISMLIVAFVVYQGNGKAVKQTNSFPVELANSKENDEVIEVADNALYVQEEEREEILENMYEDIPDDQIEEYEDMSVDELREDLDELGEQYEVGEPFSEEDQNKVLFAYEKYGNLGKDDNGLEEVSYTWRTYKIGNTKTKHGVKIGYSGKLKTYVTATGGKYYTDVKVTVYSGKSNLKNSQWKTSHVAYGILGLNGKVPSLGLVYSGSVKGDKYSGTFSFERTKNYASLVTCYTKTWGTLTVRCKEGEFDMNTTVKSSWE